ncbi:cobalamin B12-binding domain-containing protein [Ornithinimicrobium kibberense]|uniref:GDSL-like lipase/acylhydrolase family protein n=1 Tax=Ornithinimicrobium kibberense TaxID=282060 RepID=A0ABV5V6D1_9MICO|nr:cobalamin B12-binding domain-containing protein [Ornithinimicrobium kibberense]
MALSTRTQNALIAGLAALAVGTSAFAVWSVNRPHPSLTDAPASTAGIDAGTDAAPSTSDVSADESTSEPTTETSAPSDESATEQPTTEDDSSEVERATVRDWVDAWSDEADLLVIGDGYSNMPSQWVQLWGDEVGTDRPVTIHHWGEAQDVTFNDPIVLSEENGPQLTIWSASRDGTTIADAAERIDRFAEEAGGVDAVLISLGMDSEDEDVADSLDELLAEVDGVADDVPVLLAVAPPELYDAGVADDIVAWAEDNHDRVAVVEVGPAAPDNPTAEEWALAFDQVTSSG